MPKVRLFFATLVVTSLSLTAANQLMALELSIGGSVNQHTVNVHTTEGENEKRAQFVSYPYITPAFGLASNPSYFGHSRFGWLFELSMGSYNITTQADLEGDRHNYGTVVRGIFGHLNPIVFYRFGDRYMLGEKHWSITLGTGYGLSYLSVEGRFFTDHEPYAIQKDVRLSGAQGYFLLPAAFYKLTYWNWYLNVFSCFGGPGFVSGDYTYRLIFRSVTVGYSFEI